MRLVRQDRARRSRCDRRLSALAQAAENGIVTGAGLSIASVDEKGATLITGVPNPRAPPAPAWPRATPPRARARRWTWCTAIAAALRSNASRLAECWRDLHT